MTGFRLVVLKLLGGSSVVTLLNFGRDIAIATAFGVSASTDQFFLAISIPVLVITVASNAFRSVAVPLLRDLRLSDQYPANQIAQRLLRQCVLFGLAIAAITIALAILGSQFLPPYSAMLAGTCAMLTLVVPMYVASGLTEMSQGVLQAYDRYLGPTLARAGLPLGLIVAAMLLMQSGDITKLPIGGLVFAAFGLLTVIYLIHLHRLLPAWGTPSLPIEIRNKVSTNLKFLVIATCITYLNPIIDQWMAALLYDGAVSQLGYANRLAVGIASLLSGSIAAAILNHFSQLVAQSNNTRVHTDFRLFVVLGLAGGLLCALMLIAASNPLVSLLYERGNFSSEDGKVVVFLLQCLAFQYPFLFASVPAYTLISAKLLNKFFVPLGLTLITANIAGNLILMSFFGLPGIAIGTVVVYCLSVLTMVTYLVSRKHASLSLFDLSIIAGLLALGFSMAIDLMQRNSVYTEQIAAELLVRGLLYVAIMTTVLFAVFRIYRSRQRATSV